MIKYLLRSLKGKSKWLLTSTAVSFAVLLLFLPVASAGAGSSESGKTVKEAVQSTEQGEGNVLHFTDIHFNPFYDTKEKKLVSKLKDSGAGDWEKIFKTSKFKKLVTDEGKRPKEYPNETTYNLFVSSLEKMADVSPKPDFIIFTGDFLVHNFNTKYKNNFGSLDGFEAFVKKTVTFVVIMVDKYFPDTPVYVSLGNNDAYRGNYEIEPEGKFLRETMCIISEKWLEKEPNRKSFSRTYPVGGYFTVVPPKSRDTRVISLNSIFFDHKRENKKNRKNKYNYECKWAFDQLFWLRKQLESAKVKNEKVWLLMHSPPGADYFNASKGKFAPFWHGYYAGVFARLISDYSSRIKAMYAGHTHMDEFQLVFDCTGRSENAIAFVKICPSASNVRDTNNPAFLNLIYNRTNFSLMDYGVYYLDLAASDKKWKLEYMFSESYHQTAVNAATLQAVYAGIENQGAMRAEYVNYFDVSHRHQAVLTKCNWKDYWCGIASLQKEDFEKCKKKKKCLK